MGHQRLAIAGLVLATLALGCVGTDSVDDESSSVDSDQAADTSKTFAGHFASPTVVRDGARHEVYVAKQTVNGKSMNAPHGSFTDFGAWKFHGDALPKLGKHASPHGVVWAPAAAKISEGHWMLYYTAHLEGTEEKKCIWRAHATSANGPFKDDYDGPIQCQEGSHWAIDPYLVQGDGGKWHLAARLDEPGGINTIQIRRLDATGEHFSNGSKWKLLTKNAPHSWEQPVLENAGIVQLTPKGETEGHWFVFYSGRAWDDDSYAIGYADCGTRITGEDRGDGEPRCKKVTTDGPWLKTNADDNLFGPGTPTFFTDEEGHTLMSIQAWQHKNGKRNKDNHGQIMKTYKIKVDDHYKPSVKLLHTDT